MKCDYCGGNKDVKKVVMKEKDSFFGVWDTSTVEMCASCRKEYGYKGRSKRK